MAAPKPDLRALVEAFGPHPMRHLGLEAGSDPDLAGWLLAAALLGGRVDEGVALAAFRALDARGLTDPATLAMTGPQTPARILDAERFPKPEPTAARLVRLAAGLGKAGGSLTALADTSDGLEELGSKLIRLAPGFGVASVGTFLRPLRDAWWAAAELPLHPAARAAAVHLDYIAGGDDEDGAPRALHRFVGQSEDPVPPFADVEWALERVGRRACQAPRPRRCPFPSSCPVR